MPVCNLLEWLLTSIGGSTMANPVWLRQITDQVTWYIILLTALVTWSPLRAHLIEQDLISNLISV